MLAVVEHVPLTPCRPFETGSTRQAKPGGFGRFPRQRRATQDGVNEHSWWRVSVRRHVMGDQDRGRKPRTVGADCPDLGMSPGRAPTEETEVAMMHSPRGVHGRAKNEQVQAFDEGDV